MDLKCNENEKTLDNTAAYNPSKSFVTLSFSLFVIIYNAIVFVTETSKMIRPHSMQDVGM